MGTGVSAIAYQHQKHPTLVLKSIQLTGPNDCTLAFIRLCNTHKQNPFFPNIHAVKIYHNKILPTKERKLLYNLLDPHDTPPDIGEYVMLVLMEKLFPINHNHVTKSVGIKLLQQYNIIPSDPSLLLPNISGIKDPLYMTRFPFLTSDSRRILREQNYNSNKELFKALRLLEPIFQANHADMHQRNIMLRKINSPNHELVFMDPVC